VGAQIQAQVELHFTAGELFNHCSISLYVTCELMPYDVWLPCSCMSALMLHKSTTPYPFRCLAGPLGGFHGMEDKMQHLELG
jgi:hypothetical protein